MKFSPQQILVFGFAGVILIGSVILSLPVSAATLQSVNFVDAFFTATSAVCVTGLIVVNTATQWSLFGKIIILLLIQIGGLGYMTLATLFVIMLGKQISLKDRLTFAEGIQTFSFVEIKKFIVYVVKITLLIEFAGALILSIKWIPEFGIVKGFGHSIFHSVSAFCNAGFSTFGQNLMNYVGSIPINLGITSLIILGGIGYIVISDVYSYKKTKRLLLHTKVAIFTTAVLIISGTVLIFLLEKNNPSTLGLLTLKNKLLSAYFQSVSPRTAGFNTIDISALTASVLFLIIGLMFIGASPSGTGGGIKTTTFATIFASIKATLKGRKNVSIFKRRIGTEIVQKSFILGCLAVTFISVITFLILIIEGKDFIRTLFEVVSAFAT
ncbi:MAG: TrkH family potassium uptake protein, partial [Elusimicrobiota bacterium]|nr:TrkH family potassium uptake protein [Elusimicrobiota bacterium]